MSIPAVRVEGLGKRYRLGETHEYTLTDQLGRLLRRLSGRKKVDDRCRPEDFWALQDVSFEVMPGEAVGIIGSNGAGKSTLLKILSRITPPTTGRAIFKGRLSSLLEVGTGFHPELTGRENVFLNGTILGMSKVEIQRKFDEIVAFAGVEPFIDTPVKRYSSGMRVRLAFSVAAHLEPDILVVDEVLAVGDAGFQKRCLGKMNEVAREGRTVLFVSHNMAAIQKLCNRAVWLQQGRVVSTGSPDVVVSEYLETTAATTGDAATATPGFLFYRDPAQVQSDVAVNSLQLLDKLRQPLTQCRTWDRVIFRVGFVTRRSLRSLSAVLTLNTPEGVALILTSTTPDNSVPFSAGPGTYMVECEFDALPLAAGEYVIGLGLAIPGIEYLWRDDALCRLHVSFRDIFQSGLPPASNRYWIATQHCWTVPWKLETGDMRKVING